MRFGTILVKCCCEVKIGLDHYFGFFFSIFCAQMITFFVFKVARYANFDCISFNSVFYRGKLIL